MKLRLALFLIVPLVLFAEDANKKDPKPAAARTEIPADAVPIGASSWRYTDPQGKTWIYRKTPFGVMKKAETEKAAPAQKAPAANWKATEKDGLVYFERTSPFGLVRWTRSRDRMSDAERRVWERDCAQKEAEPVVKAAPKE